MSQLRSVFKKSKSTWQFECLSELECSGKVLVEYIIGLYWWSMLSYLIFVTNAANAVRVNFLAECKKILKISTQSMR